MHVVNLNISYAKLKGTYSYIRQVIIGGVGGMGMMGGYVVVVVKGGEYVVVVRRGMCGWGG